MTTGGEGECGVSDGSVVYQTEHDPDDGTELSTSVLLALEELPEFDLEDGENVVFDDIDLDALDDLFRPVNGDSRSGHVTFPAAQYDVTVTATGQITVWE
jgi:hypothetical protein